MIATENNWFAEWQARPWPRGILVIGGVGPDGKVFTQTLAEGPSQPVKNEAWQALTEAVTQLDAYGCGGNRSVWVFESAAMWVARRTDGAWVGIFGPREISEATRAEIDSRLEEFTGTLIGDPADDRIAPDRAED